ncbi:hypothetical protein JCM8097_007926 [Rhodosporidiobolus ruineniae]
MSSFASATPPPARATLLGLPLEVKARIVELVARQDEALSAVKAALPSRLSSEMQQDVAKWTEHDGNSLGALFRVCREFSALAAVHRFQVCKASRADYVFEAYVAPYRMLNFTRIELDSDDQALLKPTILALFHTHQVKVLTIHRKALRAISFPFDPEPDPAGTTLSDYLFRAIKHLEKSSPQLELLWFGGHRIASMIDVFGSGLRSLRLHACTDHLRNGALDLAAKLSLLSNLEDLQISAPYEETEFDVSRLCQAIRQTGSTCSLRRLTINVPFFHPSLIELAHLFASTLEVLILESIALYCDGSSGDWGEVVFRDEVFPCLTRLSITSEWIFSSDIIPSLHQKDFPALQHLSLTLFNLDGDLNGHSDPLKDVHLRLPHVQTIRFNDGGPLCPKDAQEFARRCDPLGITTLPAPDFPVFPSYPFFHDERDNAPPDSGYAAACRPYVKKLSAFLANEVKRAEREDDDKAFVELAEALKRLEVRRVVRTI